MRHPLRSTSAAASDLALAGRIESLRHERGLSLDAAADLTGLSRATISRIERGETSPTANALGRLCGAYGLTMSRLMAAVEEGSPRLLRGVQAARWRDPENGYLRTLIAPPNVDYATELALGELPSGVEIHYDGRQAPGREQFFYLIEGALSVDLEGENYRLSPGDCLRHRGVDATRIGNPGDTPARYLIINSTTT
jgi:transcriptional regulator with XRE-family HTH domain